MIFKHVVLSHIRHNLQHVNVSSRPNSLMAPAKVYCTLRVLLLRARSASWIAERSFPRMHLPNCRTSHPLLRPTWRAEVQTPKPCAEHAVVATPWRLISSARRAQSLWAHHHCRRRSLHLELRRLAEQMAMMTRRTRGSTEHAGTAGRGRAGVCCKSDRPDTCSMERYETRIGSLVTEHVEIHEAVA